MIAKNTVKQDDILYHAGEEIPDLGSWVATSVSGEVRNYEGLSKDINKLPHYCATGSGALCLDTGEYYKFEKTTDTWYKL